MELKAAGSASYNWSGVIEFLLQQCRQSSARESEWELEKKELQGQLTHLEANLKVQEGLNSDLVRRVKMLEVALKRERMKFMAYLSKVNHEEREQILAELRRTEADQLPKKVETEIAQQRPDLELSKRRAKRQRNFLEKVLKEFDCADILEEIKKYDEDSTFDKRGSNAELEAELLASPKVTVQNRMQAGIDGAFGDRATRAGRDLTEGPSISLSFKMRLHSDELRGFSLADDGKRLASVGEDGKLAVLNLESLQTRSPDNFLFTEATNDSTGLQSVATRGSTIFTGSTEGRIRLWELGKSLTPVDVFEYHKDIINNLKVHSRENVLLSTSYDGMIRGIKFRPGGFIDKSTALNYVLGHTQTPVSLAWSGDGKTQFAVGVIEDSELFIFDLNSPKPKTTIRTDSGKTGAVRHLSAIPGEQTYLAACEDGKLLLVDSLVGSVVQKYEGHSLAATITSVSSDGLHFASGGNDGLVKVWDRRKGWVIAETQSHKRRQDEVVTGLTLLKEQQSLISGGADGDIMVYKLNNLF